MEHGYHKLRFECVEELTDNCNFESFKDNLMERTWTTIFKVKMVEVWTKNLCHAGSSHDYRKIYRSMKSCCWRNQSSQRPTSMFFHACEHDEN